MLSLQRKYTQLKTTIQIFVQYTCNVVCYQFSGGLLSYLLIHTSVILLHSVVHELM